MAEAPTKTERQRWPVMEADGKTHAKDEKGRLRYTYVDPTETPADRFKRVATPRLRRALTTIAQIGKMSTSDYESTAEQRKVIYDALTAAVADMSRRLNREKTGNAEITL